MGYHGSIGGMPNAGRPARGCAVEAIGACTCRTKVKRRKACAVDEPARSGEIRYLLVTARVLATTGVRSLLILTQRDLLGCPCHGDAELTRRTKERKATGPTEVRQLRSSTRLVKASPNPNRQLLRGGAKAVAVE